MKQQTNQENEPVAVSADELAALDEGIRSEETEQVYSLDEAFEFARKRRKKWMKTPAQTPAR